MSRLYPIRAVAHYSTRSSTGFSVIEGIFV
jgi:hypothetical protein